MYGILTSDSSFRVVGQEGAYMGSLASRLAAIGLVKTTPTPTETPIPSIIDVTPIGSRAILLLSAGALILLLLILGILVFARGRR
jgi:hypothetical protein